MRSSVRTLLARWGPAVASGHPWAGQGAAAAPGQLARCPGGPSFYHTLLASGFCGGGVNVRGAAGFYHALPTFGSCGGGGGVRGGAAAVAAQPWLRAAFSSRVASRRAAAEVAPPVRLPASEFADTLLKPSAPGLGRVPVRVYKSDYYPYLMPAAALPLAGVPSNYRGPLAAALVVFDGADAYIERRLFKVRIDSRDVKPETPAHVCHGVAVQGLGPLARLGGGRTYGMYASYDASEHVVVTFGAVAATSDSVVHALPQGADIIIGMQRLSPRRAILSPTSLIKGGPFYADALAEPRAFHGPYRSPPPAGSDIRMPTVNLGPFDAGNHVLVGATPNQVGTRADLWHGVHRFGAPPTEATCTVPILARFVAQVSYDTVAVLDLLDLLYVNHGPHCKVTSMEAPLTKIHAELPRLGARLGGGIDRLCLVFLSPADMLKDARNDVPANLVANVDLVIRVGYPDAFTPPEPPRGTGAAGVGALLARHGITAADLDRAARRFHFIATVAPPVPGRKPPLIYTTRVFRDIAPGVGTKLRYTIKSSQYVGQERTVQARNTLIVAIRPDGSHKEWLARMTLNKYSRKDDSMYWDGCADDEVLAARSGGLQCSAQWSGNMAYTQALAYLGVRIPGRTMHEPAFGPGGIVSFFYALAPNGKTPVIFIRKAKPEELGLWESLPRARRPSLEGHDAFHNE